LSNGAGREEISAGIDGGPQEPPQPAAPSVREEHFHLPSSFASKHFYGRGKYVASNYRIVLTLERFSASVG
jgi:hypothetical protein